MAIDYRRLITYGRWREHRLFIVNEGLIGHRQSIIDHKYIKYANHGYDKYKCEWINL